MSLTPDVTLLVQAWKLQKQPNHYKQLPCVCGSTRDTILSEKTQFPQTYYLSLDKFVDIAQRLQVNTVAHVAFEHLETAPLLLAKSTKALILISHTIQDVLFHSLLAYLVCRTCAVVHLYRAKPNQAPERVPKFDLPPIGDLLQHGERALDFDDACATLLTLSGFKFTPFLYDFKGKSRIFLALDSFNSNVEEIDADVLQIKLFSPWQHDQFMQCLSRGVEEIIMIEADQDAFGNSLYHDIVQSIDQLDVRLTFIPQEKSTTTITKPADRKIDKIQGYTELIDILSASSKGHVTKYEIFDSDAGQCLGKLIGDQANYTRFVASVRNVAENAEMEFKELLMKWLSDSVENTINHGGQEIITYLENNQQLHIELYEKRSHFMNAFPWLVDVHGSMHVGNGALREILNSRDNINVLIVQNADFGNDYVPNSLGLYCLNYGTAYTATIANTFSYSQAVKAITEAQTFNGPSIVIAYLPKLNNQASAIAAIQHMTFAIDQGKLSLYRWNPQNSRQKLTLDSSKHKVELEKFIESQSAYSIITQSTPEFVENDQGSQLALAAKNSAKVAYDNLSKNINRKRLLVLYGSDGGTGEHLAKQLGQIANSSGLFAKVMAMDNYMLEDLGREENVVFIVSTAGQGEFPCNARESWKFLASTKDLDITSTRFAVFSLGDSHYWPRQEDAHYYCKAGKDLDCKLVELGAIQSIPIGLGDDRDPDGYLTAYRVWVETLWEALGIESVSAGTQATIPSDDAIKGASNYLRGTIAKGLLDESTGALAEYDTKLTKFHGIYQQDDRDLREKRAARGLEKAFSFMIRVRVPGGVSTPEQWLAMDEIAEKHANGTIKLTTRQAFQFHGVLKRNLKQSIQEINRCLLGKLD